MESKPDIVIFNKMEKTAIIIDVAKSGDKVITDKENKMIEKYRNLKKKIERLWNLKRIDVIPVILVPLESITKNFGKHVNEIRIKIDLRTA